MKHWHSAWHASSSRHCYFLKLSKRRKNLDVLNFLLSSASSAPDPSCYRVRTLGVIVSGVKYQSAVEKYRKVPQARCERPTFLHNVSISICIVLISFATCKWTCTILASAQLLHFKQILEKSLDRCGLGHGENYMSVDSDSLIYFFIYVVTIAIVCSLTLYCVAGSDNPRKSSLKLADTSYSIPASKKDNRPYSKRNLGLSSDYII